MTGCWGERITRHLIQRVAGQILRDDCQVAWVETRPHEENNAGVTQRFQHVDL